MSHSLSTQHSGLRVHGALTLVALLFSANYIVSKLAMRAFNPLVFAYLRVIGSAIVLNLIIHEREPAALSRRDAWHLIGFSILGVVINQTLFLTGLHFTSANVAAILVTTIPVFALGAAIALGRERPTAAKAGGIALAAAGALLVVGREGFSGTAKSLVRSLHHLQLPVVRALPRAVEADDGAPFGAAGGGADVRRGLRADAAHRRLAAGA